MRNYTPSKLVLDRYADVLVRFALGNGKGVKRGEVVYINAPEVAKPLLFAVQNAVFKAGGHAILNYRPNNTPEHNFSASFFKYTKDAQIDFFPAKYMRGLVDEMDHVLFIIGETNPHALKEVDPKMILRRGRAMKPYMDWRRDKEYQGKLSWTIGLYGTEAMAKEARMSLESYWQEIIKACYLNESDPIKKWRDTYKQIGIYRDRLNSLAPQTDKLHIKGVDEDLWITLGKSRKWVASTGQNIPSFEIFTSPDWRGTQGWVRINQPLYRYGNLVKGIELWFKDGVVVKSRAKQGEKLLRAMIATPGADKVGEFSLTDRRHSKITKFMAETLFDENIGGPQGNTHIALGASYPDTFSGDVSKLSKDDMAELGFNDSSVHTDVISTAKRTVTAHLKGGKTRVIYDNGEFVL